MRGADWCRRGFTLIEMMAVVLFTGIVLTAAVNFYLDVATATHAATERTREGRRAVALLDRVARDLESSVLIATPDDVDPLENPWVFHAESRGGEFGADRVKFVSRGRTPRSEARHESDLEIVSYVVVARELEEEGYDLVRWSAPRLPEARDTTFPALGDDGALVLAEGIGGFGLRFLGEDGAWIESWDSSQLSESGELPLAVEIRLLALPPALDDFGFADELPVYARQVTLPVRPIDLSQVLPQEEEEEDEDEEEEVDCTTVDECRGLNASVFSQAEARLDPINAALLRVGDTCFEDVAHLFAGAALVGCQ